MTLTYRDEDVPKLFGVYPTLCKRDFVLFMKRLRKRCGSGIRFYHCGEYGETTERPHYHACLFNFDASDKVEYASGEGKHPVFKSAMLNEIWGHGECLLGAMTFETAAYTARYCLKKLNGDPAKEKYERVCPVTGQVGYIEKEYATMSLRPGIGYNWFLSWMTDAYPSDFIVCRGVKQKPPRYYDALMKSLGESEMEMVKRKRVRRARVRAKDRTPERLEVAAKVAAARAAAFKRSFEKE